MKQLKKYTSWTEIIALCRICKLVPATKQLCVQVLGQKMIHKSLVCEKCGKQQATKK